MTVEIPRPAFRVVARMLARKVEEGADLGRRIIPQDAEIDKATRNALKSLGYIR